MRYYQQQGKGDPFNRSDEIHDIATGSDEEVSLDDAGIDELCMRVNMSGQDPAISLKHFSSIQDAVSYITSELLSTLRDDLDNMTSHERKHYSNEDRKEMRNRIKDVEQVADLICKHMSL